MDKLLKILVVVAWVAQNQKPLSPAVKRVAIQCLKDFVPEAKSFQLSIVILKKIKKILEAPAFTEEMCDDVYDIGKALSTTLAIVKKNTKISLEQQNLFASIGTFLRNMSSDSAYKRINDNIGITADPVIESIFTVDTNIDKNLQKKLAFLTKKLGGKGDKLSFAEQREVSKDLSKLTLYKEYLATNLALNKQYKAAVVSLIRKNQGKPMLLSDIKMKLAKYGLPNSWWPQIDEKHGFKVAVDKKGNPALLTQTNKTVMQFPRGDAVIKVNPLYNHATDNTYPFKVAVPGAVSEQQIYTHEFNKAKRSAANNKVLDSLPNIDKYVQKWESDILKAKSVDACMPALVSYLLYQLSARIGSPAGKTAGETTYGLSTVLNRQVKVALKTVTFTYPGKKGVVQTHIYDKTKHSPIVAKKVFEFLNVLKARTKPNETFFSNAAGKRITGPEVNTYLKSTGMPVTAHKVRHLRGSDLFSKLVKNYKVNPASKNPQSEAERFLKNEVLPEVGKILGHHRADGSNIGATASKAYISPKMQKEFFTSRGLKVPLYIAALHD